MNETNKISAVVNTYNASKYLSKVLDALKKFDEILVCDMESTDSTLDIAKAYGCRIVTFPKANNKIVEPARTFAIQSAKNEWVLVVDADEIVTSELHDYLYDRIKDENCPSGLYIPRYNMFLGRHIKEMHDYQLRFFKRDGTEWPSYIHSIPHIDGVIEKIPKRLKRVCLMHLNDCSISDEINKMNMYTDMELEKKKSREYGLFSLMYRPLWFSFRCYFIFGAWHEGRRGMIRSLMKGFSEFVTISKIMEVRMRQN